MSCPCNLYSTCIPGCNLFELRHNAALKEAHMPTLCDLPDYLILELYARELHHSGRIEIDFDVGEPTN